MTTLVLILMSAFILIASLAWTIYGLGKFLLWLEDTAPDESGFYCTGPAQQCSCKGLSPDEIERRRKRGLSEDPTIPSEVE